MAKAQELMEQNPELSKAVTELEEQTLEEQVLAKLKEIESILTKIDSESIDLSVFLSQIQSFSDEKKAELQALVDKLDNPLGSKTITMKTFDDGFRLNNGGLFWQEVWEKDGVITRYGDVFFSGYKDTSGNGGFDTGSADGFARRQPLPKDVEFDMIFGSSSGFLARPKAGQSNVGGVVGSLDNVLFVWGANLNGCLGTGSTSTVSIPKAVTLQGRVAYGTSKNRNNTQGATYLILENGDLYFAGYSVFGESGLGSTAQVNAFTKISSLSGVRKVLTSGMTTFALTDTRLYGWGLDRKGWLGCGVTTDQTSPKECMQFQSGKKVDISAMQYYVPSSADYGVTLVSVEGQPLVGAGDNIYNNITSADTSTKITFTQVVGEASKTFTIGENDDFFTPFLTTYILQANDDGNTDFYSGGITAFGDTSSTTKRAIKKAKTFDGLGWKFLKWYQRQDADYILSCFIWNEKKREMWACGKNYSGQLGVGSDTENEYILKEVVLPTQVKNAKSVEARFNANGYYGSLVIIADGVLWSCGSKANNRTKSVTNTLQIQARA